jgi:hypothetical protein
VPLSAGTRLRPYQIVAMLGAREMGDGRRSVVVKVISSVFRLGIQKYLVPTVMAMIGRQSAPSEGIPSIGHNGFHIDVESHP